LPAFHAWPSLTQPERIVPITLFTFDNAAESEWSVVNDGVMGGRSSGFVAVSNGALRFTGSLVTQGGGFTLTRARCVVNLTGQAGLELRVRGSGRQFQLEVDDGERRFGRNVSRRASFPTTAEWTVVRIPFTALRNTIFGQTVQAPPIDLTRIQSVGLYIRFCRHCRDGTTRSSADWAEVCHRTMREEPRALALRPRRRSIHTLLLVDSSNHSLLVT